MAKVVVDPIGIPVFTVEMGVGVGRANNKDDVTLVQYLLNLWLTHSSMVVARQKMGSANSRKLDVDGIYGPKTGNRIRQFQKWAVSESWPLMCDGRVDKNPNGSCGEIKDTRKSYTIDAINTVIYVKYHTTTFGTMTSLGDRSDFPNSLKMMISRYLFSKEL